MNDCPEKFMRSFSRRTIAVVCSLPLVLALGCSAQAQSPGPDAKALDGKTLAFDRGKGNCLSCHDIKGGDLPGTIGPQLNDMKSRFPDRNELIGIVTDETKRNPQTVMPPFGRNLILNDKEISAIVEFLYTL
jgi:sulfur-oxidizing protein SoxX